LRVPIPLQGGPEFGIFRRGALARCGVGRERAGPAQSPGTRARDVTLPLHAARSRRRSARSPR
jgi:hypothetical protein